MKKYIRYLCLALLGLFLWDPALAQPAQTPHHSESVFVDLGTHDGLVTDRKQIQEDRSFTYFPEDYKVIRETVRAGAVPWMQVLFDEGANLGEHSYVIITSLYDRDFQYFNAKSLKDWYFRSAFFKGNAVEVELYVAPNEQDISLRIVGMTVGEFLGDDINVMTGRTQCGPTDDRSSTSIPMRDGRLMPLGCTGWTTAGGFYLTAGHCVNVSSSSLQIMEFDVPASLCNGTTQPAAVTNQYPVNYGHRDWQEAGVGDDWGIYDVNANSNTGLTPNEARRSYYHLTKANPSASIQIRGFGTDDVPVGCTGYRNADNQTLQWHTGTNLGENVTSSTDIDWEYQTDTEGGNSGSAVRASGVLPDADLHHAIGIHTHGGCTNPLGSGGNHGTSFEADDTEIGMNTFWQTEVEYVDVDHHLSNVTGTSVWPHYSLQNALNQANAGHGPAISALELILIAGSNRLSNSSTESGGVYAESISYSGATNGVLLRRTVGAVKIGPFATASPPPVPTSPEEMGPTDPVTDIVRDPELQGHIPIGPSLQEGAFTLAEFAKVYPNPFTGETTLEFLFNEDRQMTIRLVNALGQQVMTLAENQVHDAGLHRIMIDGSKLTAGIYYVVMEGPDYREMIKISRFE
jgi:V8-like Glu-specific endopeptidase